MQSEALSQTKRSPILHFAVHEVRAPTAAYVVDLSAEDGVPVEMSTDETALSQVTDKPEISSQFSDCRLPLQNCRFLLNAQPIMARANGSGIRCEAWAL